MGEKEKLTASVSIGEFIVTPEDMEALFKQITGCDIDDESMLYSVHTRDDYWVWEVRPL